MVKFVHMADCHIGAWSAHPELRELPLKAFRQAVNKCIEEKVDFVIIAGDLFDTSIPGIDFLKATVEQLKKLMDAGISVYAVPGSHDFSPSGKSMMDVMEKAGLLTRVNKGAEENGNLKLELTRDKSGVVLAGVLGKKGSIEHGYYENLIVPEFNEFGIFVMHSAIAEYKPESMQKMSGLPLSLLPDGFSYYASGHMHSFAELDTSKGKLVYPGPLFPANFPELEKGYGSFVFVDLLGEGCQRMKIRKIETDVCKTKLINIDGNNKTPMQIEQELENEMIGLQNRIVLVRVKGVLAKGRPSDIDFARLGDKAVSMGAIGFKKNITQLQTKEEENIRVKSELVDEVEDRVLEESSMDKELIKHLMHALDDERQEGETVQMYEERIKQKAKNILGVEQ
jgi:hypothetical protein